MPTIRRREYDVVVVGARCAGASLAAFLARAGAEVLLLDKDPMPSDQVLSTHSVHSAGMEVLDELGVGEAVRSVAPPSRVIRANLEGMIIDFEQPAAAYCPRRQRLDGLLQQAASAAGAEIIDRARVVSLVRDHGRVRGVRAAIDGHERVFTGSLVVGADGRWSSVARLVESEEYLGYDAPRAVFWAYWDAPSFWRTDPTYGFDMYFSHLDGQICAIFQTDHDQLLMGSSPPTNRTDAWRADPRRALHAALVADPVAGPLVRESQPDGKVRGTVKERYFFRRAMGDGWALVGDAGIHKEFLLGDGITEALLQARSLATAIGEGTHAALARWWRARDVAILPLYFLGQEIAGREPPLEFLRFAFSQLCARPELNSRLAAVIARELLPFEAIPASQIAGWVMKAATRGRWGVMRELLAAGQRASVMSRELRARKRLLARAEAAMGASREGHRPARAAVAA